MQTERFHGWVEVTTGTGREFWGRITHDGALEARGKVERLAGEAVLACHRARTGVARLTRDASASARA